MTHQESGIHRQPALESSQKVTKALPVPRHPLLETLERDAFDVGKHGSQISDLFRPDGGNGESAIAANNGRDTMQARWRGRPVPEQLGVVVGVNVHHAWRHDQTVSVDLPGAAALNFSYRSDPASADSEVATPPGLA